MNCPGGFRSGYLRIIVMPRPHTAHRRASERYGVLLLLLAGHLEGNTAPGTKAETVASLQKALPGQKSIRKDIKAITESFERKCRLAQPNVLEARARL